MPRGRDTGLSPGAGASRHDRHFATDHLLSDIKVRSVRGGTYAFGATAARFVLNTGSTMVLARLLDPGDFGLIAMVLVVTGFVEMFKDAGLSVATVQQERITHEQVSALFWINVALSVALMSVVMASAPLIAMFYRESRLVPITLVLAGTFVFGGLAVQHQALLRRQMRFKALATIEVSSVAIGIAGAVAMALAGFGYWSLVGLTAITSAVSPVLAWTMCAWRPGPPRRAEGVGAMVRFGGGLTGFNFLNYFTRNADNVIVGYSLGAGPLGVYSKAYNLLMLPIRQINSPVTSVMLAALSRLQDQSSRYRRAYLQAISAVTMASMPIVACAFVLADEAVAVLLGPGWEQAATVFRWLGPAAFFGTLNVAPGWLCTSHGRTSVQLAWALIVAPITVGGFAIGVRWGLAGVAGAFSLTWCFGLYLFLAMACRGSPVRQRDVAGAIAPQVAASLIAAAAGWVVLGQLVDMIPNAVGRGAAVAPVICLVYIGMLWLAPTSRAQLKTLMRDGLRSALIAETPSK